MDREDVAFYRSLASQADGPVLELGCGTGRVYLSLLAAGVDADGLDRSPAVLDRLRENATERGLDPTVWRDDMFDFSVDRLYDLVICPFNTVQHASTVDTQLSLLAAVYEALAPGGQFVFDTFVPQFEVICETYGEWRTESLSHEGSDYELRTRTQIADELRQSFRVNNELRAVDDEDVYTSEMQPTMLPYQQVELLARQSPFDDWHVRGDFDDRPVEDGDAVQVWTMEKGSEPG